MWPQVTQTHIMWPQVTQTHITWPQVTQTHIMWRQVTQTHIMWPRSEQKHSLANVGVKWRLDWYKWPSKFRNNWRKQIAHYCFLVLQLCALWKSDDILDVHLQFSLAGIIPQSLQFQLQETITNQSNVTTHESAPSFVCVDQCICAVRAVEVPVLVCLRSSCNHVNEVRGA